MIKIRWQAWALFFTTLLSIASTFVLFFAPWASLNVGDKLAIGGSYLALIALLVHLYRTTMRVHAYHIKWPTL